jgi:hypothetical protein
MDGFRTELNIEHTKFIRYFLKKDYDEISAYLKKYNVEPPKLSDASVYEVDLGVPEFVVFLENKLEEGKLSINEIDCDEELQFTEETSEQGSIENVEDFIKNNSMTLPAYISRKSKKTRPLIEKFCEQQNLVDFNRTTQLVKIFKTKFKLSLNDIKAIFQRIRNLVHEHYYTELPAFSRMLDENSS